MSDPLIDRTQMERLFAELNRETDRGAVLVAVTILDELALNTLRAHLLDFRINSKKGRIADSLFRSDGPLGSFSSRLKLCATLGLISEKEYRLADRLRDIRNDFAHKIDIELAETGIALNAQSFFELKGLESMPEAQRPRAWLAAAAGMLVTMWGSRLAQVRRAELHTGPIGFL